MCPAGKLRDVEVMCQENEETGGAVVRKILDILYQVTGLSNVAILQRNFVYFCFFLYLGVTNCKPVRNLS